MNPVTRNRLALVLIASLFAAPFLAAWLLNAGGWRPSGARNYGELVTPPLELAAARITLADGSTLAWRQPSRTWTLFALAGPGCAAACRERIDELRRVRLTLNQNAYRTRVVVVGTSLEASTLEAMQPVQVATDADGALTRLLPGDADQLAVAFADPDGRLVLRYAPGYDGSKLRKDLERLIREGF
jgi:hypothetical protein